MELLHRRLVSTACSIIRRQVFAHSAAPVPHIWTSAAIGGVRGLRNYPIKLLIRNHKFQNKSFEVEKEWSVGIELRPSEVKSLRDHNGDISAAFAELYRGELFLHQMHIPVWRNGLIGRPEPTRVRKLLANRSELKKMEAFLQKSNALLLPMRVEVGITGWIKVILAQCFKQSKIDNRKRDEEREIKRQLKDW